MGLITLHLRLGLLRINKIMPQMLRLRSQFNMWSYFIALSLALGMVIDPVLAQEQPKPRILTVTGRGMVTIPTTVTQVSLGVEVQGKTAGEVQQELARRSSAIVALLRSRNVENLQTTSITLNPTYSSDRDGVQRFTGYIGSNIVSFRINTELSGKLLDEAVQAGATRINEINFVAADDAIAAARQQAIRNAIQDGQKQAEAALGALNFTRRDVINIQIDSDRFFSPPVNADFAARSANIAVTPVIGGERQVQAFVTLQITY